MTLALTNLQYRILELIVENFDAGLKGFNRADTLSEELPADIEEVRSALLTLEKKLFVEKLPGKIYSPTPKGRGEI